MKMKKVIIVIICFAVGLIAFNYFVKMKGASSAGSPEEKELVRLTDDFNSARKRFKESSGAAALGGTDMSDEIDKAFSEIARIESALNSLKWRLTTESAKMKAERLQNNIDVFKKSLTR